MDSLPFELLAMILDEFVNDSSMLHTCALVNRNWCVVALQYLWARPFTMLVSSPRGKKVRSVDNLLTTFIECFTDVKALQNAVRLCKRRSKKFPFDYSLYLREIHFKEIAVLTSTDNKFNRHSIRVRITRLAIKYCPNLRTLSINMSLWPKARFLTSITSLPNLQNISLHLDSHDSIFNTLSRTTTNIKSISVKVRKHKKYNFEQKSHHGLQKFVRSQRQLKTITIKNVTARMRSVFKLLESQSNSLESIVLENISFDSDGLKIKPVKFYQLSSIHIKNCQILTKGGLRSIFEADLSNLQKLKFENTDWRYTSDWTPLRNKYGNRVFYSGRNRFITPHN